MSLGILLILSLSAHAKPDYGKIFDGTDACFLMVDSQSNKSLVNYGPRRCSKKFPPCSTFKIPLSLMAFEEGIFKTTGDPIPWDHKKHTRKELNQDQTPLTWLQRSAVWVSEAVVQNIGIEKVSSYLKQYDYGNQKIFSGGTFWNGGSLTISPNEQISFLNSVQNAKFSLRKGTLDKLKITLFSKELPDGTKVYGKTGTCCIDKDCQSIPGREIGWFVGFTENRNDAKTFVLNFSDKKPVKGYAGLRAKEMFFQILEEKIVD